MEFVSLSEPLFVVVVLFPFSLSLSLFISFFLSSIIYILFF